MKTQKRAFIARDLMPHHLFFYDYHSREVAIVKIDKSKATWRDTYTIQHGQHIIEVDKPTAATRVVRSVPTLPQGTTVSDEQFKKAGWTR